MQSEKGRVRSMRSPEKRVRSRAQMPGFSGSAETESRLVNSTPSVPIVKLQTCISSQVHGNPHFVLGDYMTPGSCCNTHSA